MAGLAVLACVSIFYLSIPCSGQDTIKPGQFLPDGDTLISAGGRFELGFFSPGRSTNRFLGIWYKNITPQTVVWIANREAPITERAGIVNITDQGILTLRNGTHTLVWSSNSSRYLQSPVVQLLDSGNLVVKDGDDDSPDNFLWQSFDYPCDTLLPGMKMGKDLAKGVDKPLTSWKSSEDPGKGEYSLEIDPRGYPQGYVKKGNTTLSRKGSWWGERFTKTSAVDGQGPRITYELVFNKNEVYFKFESTGTSRYTINPSGLVQRYFWNDQTSSWMVLSTGQVDECENYALCGAYGSCYLHKSPDTSSSLYIRSIDLAECADLCLNNCSCTIFDLSRVAAATNNFSSSNKLGEGGFGPEGQAIAVKRLSRSSGQGSDELKNEVVLFSKLQHRNLVKLLGCCVCDDEKMLIYECMPNKSLDSFIFGTRYELDPAIAGIL